MKRFLTLVLMAMLIFTLSACRDRRSHDETINVVFYTHRNASHTRTQFGLEPNSLIEEPENPTRNGFIFSGWFKDLNFTQQWDFATDRVGEHSITLYAKWVPAIFQIIYDPNGGTMPAEYPTEYKPGQLIILPAPRLEGHTFVAWYTYDWTSEKDTIPGDKGHQTIPTGQVGDFVIYAHYKVIVVSVTFTINFPVQGQGPANVNSMSVPYGSTINFPVLENTAGYKFLGWNSNSSGTGTWYVNGETFVRTQRLKLFAIWEKI
ncbi:MAG: InlB B-repeat-containing protein [Acholeplasmataceae bacterium]|jgi:uncharacterized repeat protein (TIGR02543 family)|nr:InlB B-repeat-containing protein [Acholeplasmataceae bacterium]